MSFTIIEDGRATDVQARVIGNSVRIAPADVERALGWSLKSQGLCRGDVCVPVTPGAAIASDEGIDLVALASALDRPLALDVAAGAACIGDSARERAASLSAGEAPDFTLPDLSGRMHSLSDYRGRKVLLIAWASW